MRDRLLSMSSTRAQTATFKLLDRLQRLHPEEQVVSVTLSFLMLCKRFNQSPREMLELGERMIRDALSEGRGEHIRAIRDYMDKEL